MSQFESSQAEGVNSPLSASCSNQASNRLDEAHPHWGGPAALLGPLIQMLISSRNILTDKSRIMFNQIFGHTMSQSN